MPIAKTHAAMARKELLFIGFVLSEQSSPTKIGGEAPALKHTYDICVN